MASLMELVDRVNKGESIDAEQLGVYEESANSAEKFLAHHAHALLDLREAHLHMLQSLEAIDYSDQKVLNQFVSISAFLGLAEMRAGPVIKFGASAIGRRENALGMEAIANGIGYDLTHGAAYAGGRENCQFVATQYERLSQAIGFTAPAGLWSNKLTKIAVVVSAIVDDEAASKSLITLARSLDAKRFTLHIFSSEAFARREKSLFAPANAVSSSAKRGKETIEALAKLKVTTWLAPTDGDCVASTKALGEALSKEHIDVAVFDATQADAICCVTAGWDVARVKINLCRTTPMFVSGIDCVTYVDQARFEADKDAWQQQGIDCRFILEGIDVDLVMGSAPARSAFGIPEQAVVLATAGTDLDRTFSDAFVETMISILRSNPHAIYLVVGEAELSSQKRKFESAGVGKRVGYAGKRKELASFLRIADIVLAEFPASNPASVLQAMTVEKPVVACKWGESIEQSQAAVFVGPDGTVATRDPAAYIERVGMLIRDPALRASAGKSMRQRVEQHFGYNQTARLLEQLCDEWIAQKSQASAARIEQVTGKSALAQVA